MKNRIVFVCGLLLATSVLIAAFAVVPRATQAAPGDPTDPLNGELERAGSWPFGTSEAVAVDDSRQLVFLSSGGAVLVFDVTNPLAPSLLTDRIHTLGYVSDLHYDGATELLYVAAGEGGLEIWDVATPSLPTQVSVTELFYGGVDIPVEGVTVVGDFAYVAADWGFLHWVDVSDPTQPFQVGFNGAYVRPHGVYAHGGYVYAMGIDTGSFVAADLARFAIQPDGSLSFVGGRELGICSDAVVSGTLLYVGCGDLVILDLSHPSLPTVGQLAVTNSGTVISGTNAIVASGSAGLRVVDVSNPALPAQVGVYDSPGWANEVARIGNYAYLSDGHAGLRVVEIADETNPQEVAYHDTRGWARYADIQDGYAYLAEASEGVVIIDVSEPMTATEVGLYEAVGATYDVAVQGDTMYVADVDGGLRIVDISDPTNPLELGSLTGIEAFRVAVNGTYAYVADAVVNQPYWVRVIDVSNPAAPVEVGAFETTTIIWDLEVQDDYVYVANDDDGLLVLDVQNPAQPMPAGNYLVPSVWDIALQGEYAYLASADWDGGFLVLDISDPTAPTLLAEYNPSGWFHPYHVAVVGRYAYVSRDYELHLFDIGDPENPLHLQEIELPLGVSGLSADGRHVYAADGNAGLIIYQNTLVNVAATLGPDSTLETMPATTITHTFALRNMGLTDSYTLTVSGAAWNTSLLNASPVTVQSGTAVTISVAVDVPHLAPDAVHSDAFMLEATPALSPTMSLEAEGTTRAVISADPGITLSPAGITATAGSTVSYTFTITNNGNYSDAFALETGGAWGVTLPFTATAVLAPGESVAAQAWVAIPGTANGGDQETLTLTARSIWDPNESASAQATTTVAMEPEWFLYLPVVGRN